MSTRPADACPFPRPFPPGFRDCPAYRAARLVPLDSRYRPLSPGRTCQHLDVGTTGNAGRFYARCAVGTAEDRQRWADPERERLLAEAEAVSAAMEARTGVLVERLWEAKGRQLRALASAADEGISAERATQELLAVVDQVMREVDAVLADQSERLARLNLPLDTTRDFLQAILGQWVEQRTAAPPPIPDEWVERFPEQAWWLLRPRAASR